MTEPKPQTSNILIVSEEYVGQRLDNYLLREFKQLPRNLLYRLIRTGQVRVNSKRCKVKQRLVEGDAIRVPPKLRQQLEQNADGSRVKSKGNPQLSTDLQNELSQRILFEDERLLILDKPAGMAVHGGSGISLGLIEAMRLLRPELPYLELVHRLDRSTSGCLMLAKKRSALRELHRQIREKEIQKHYLTLLRGFWSQRARVALPLEVQHRKNGERHVIVSEHGKASLSHFTIQERFVAPGPHGQNHMKCSLVKVELETGRTHQIRVHAAANEHPVAADERYGDSDFNKKLAKYGLRRLFLHAHYLEFVHPGNGQSMVISTPLPKDLRSVLDQLKVI